MGVFSEEGTFDISIFEIDKEKGMVNLTKIAKHFGKEVRRWLANPSTKAFLEAIKSADGKSVTTQNVGNNGKEQGTFGTREVALKLAQWISPEFEVFCIKKLDELFQKGEAKLETYNPSNPKFWMDLQSQQQEAITYLQNALNKTSQALEQAKPAIEFTDQVHNTKEAISVQDFSNLLPNTGRTRLFRWFKEQGYLITTDTPHQTYKERGYFRVVERVRYNRKDDPIPYKTLLITGKGQTFFTKKFLEWQRSLLED